MSARSGSAKPGRPLNVLLVGNFYGAGNAGAYYMIMPKLMNGFIRAGHNAYAYNDREIARARNPFGSRKFGILPANERLVEVARDLRPELVVLGHCEMIWNRTLARMREAAPGTRIVYRNVDPLIHEQNRKDIARRSGHVDGIFVTTAGEPLREFATAPSGGNPGTFVTFMPNPIDPAIDWRRSFAAQSHAADVFFAAGPLGADDPRKTFVERLQAAVPQARFDLHGKPFGRPFLFGAAYLEALAAAKMGLSVNRTDDFAFYASDRMAQMTGNGLLTFVHRGAGFQELYGEDALAFYDSAEEAAEKLRFYLKDDSAWRKAAEAGWRRSHELFDSTRIARWIVDAAFDGGPSQDYGFPTKIWTA
ncbi:MAG: glycosyltransferase [Rhodovibrionaceae bacterium]|nr:glycosyltransferase [Rhodovibrionaceae bacterium]